MPTKAKTLTITTSSVSYAMPDDQADWLKLRNLDSANGFWVQLDSSVLSAAANADGCEFVGPGESILVPYFKNYYMIAVGASVVVNVVCNLGRV